MTRLLKVFFLCAEEGGALSREWVRAHDQRLIDLQVLVSADGPSFRRSDIFCPVLDEVKEGTAESPGGCQPWYQELDVILSDGILDPLLMLDRHNWSGTSVPAMRSYLRRQALFWLSVLDHFRPDVVVFHDSPHWASAFMLYRLCCERDIETRLTLSTPFENQLVVRKRIGGPNLASGISVKDRSLSSYMSEEIPRRRSESIRALRRMNLISPRRGLRNSAKRFASMHHSVTGPFPSTITDHRKLNVERTWTNYRSRVSARLYFERYREKSTDILPNSDYCFFALHFQPEATTVPQAGRFWDQLDVLRHLRRALPANMPILVKEHPDMLRFGKGWERTRGPKFLDELLSLSCVQLVRMDVPSELLVGRATMVATCTGTVGFEAASEGVPVVCYGFPWYLSLEGVYSFEDIDAAFRASRSRTVTQTRGSDSLDKGLETMRVEGQFWEGPWRDSEFEDSELCQLSAERLVSAMICSLQSTPQSVPLWEAELSED